MSTVLEHSDEVSGTTILDDGTKIYWTEGRSSEVAIVHADGTKEKIRGSDKHPILEAAERVHMEGADEYREMTQDEMTEWWMARY